MCSVHISQIGTAKKANLLESMNESLPEWLDGMQRELADELEGQTCIYLDINHWIKLRGAAHDESGASPVYGEILGLLKSLRQRREIFCPISGPVLEELMKQSDSNSRSKTARIMDFFSGGVCLRSWLELVEMQWFRDFTRVVLQRPVTHPEQPWTKVGFWAGAGHSENAHAIWALTVEQWQSLPNWIPAEHFVSRWVEDVKKARCEDKQAQQRRFAELEEHNRCELIRDLEEPMKSALRDRLSGRCDLVDGMFARLALQFIESTDRKIMPTLQVLAGLETAATLSNWKADPHDFFDFLHAAVAIPYCTALFTDRPLAQLLQHPSLDFASAYGKVILSEPDDILAYLKP